MLKITPKLNYAKPFAGKADAEFTVEEMNEIRSFFEGGTPKETPERREKYQNKKGDEYELVYDSKNRLKTSYKNGEPFKEYRYYEPDEEKLYSSFGKHKFADESRVTNRGYYSILPENVKQWAVLNNGVWHDVCQNVNAKYKGEPICVIEESRGCNREKRITFKEDGEEKVEFQTMDEAHEFFLKKYGIDTEFPNLSIAYITKETVEDIIEKSGDKNIFDGLKMVCRPCKPSPGESQAPLLQTKVEFSGLEKYKNVKLNEENISEFYDNLKDEDICVKDIFLCFNSDYYWPKYERVVLDGGKVDEYATCSVKHGIAHELGHYFHIKNNPRLAAKSAQVPTSVRDRIFMRDVSNYAHNSYIEFVAEYFGGKLAGMEYDKVISDIYKACGGFDIEA